MSDERFIEQLLRVHYTLVGDESTSPGQLESILARTSQVRQTRDHRLAPPTIGRWGRTSNDDRVAARRLRAILVLAMLGLLLLAIALALTVAGSRTQDDPATVPIEVESVWVGRWQGLVGAQDGSVWAQGANGTLVHDPTSGETRILGPANGAVFTRAGPLSPATSGGIWLYDDATQSIVRAEGGRPVESIGVPGAVCDIVDDGRLAIATCDGTIAKRDGKTWMPMAGPVPGGAAVELASGSDGTTWVRGNGLWQLVAGSWVRHDETGAPSAHEILVMAAGPDGTLWVAGDAGFARYDGVSWDRFLDPEWGTVTISALAIADDGSVWGAGRFAKGNEARNVAIRLDERSSQLFDLPVLEGTDSESSGLPSIVATRAGVFASGSGSLTRFVGDRFEILDTRGGWPDLERVQSIAVDSKGRPWVLAGWSGTVPQHELAIGEIFQGGYAKHISGDLMAADLQEGPRGSIWMATPEGPGLVVGQGSEDVDVTNWNGVELVGPELSLEDSVAPSTHTLVLPPYAIDPDGTPYTVVGNRVVHLIRDRWAELPPHPGADDGTYELAVAPDGAIWVATGHGPDSLGVARYRDDHWEVVALPDGRGSEMTGVTAIAFDRAGAAWLRLVLQDVLDARLRLAVARSVGGSWTLDDRVGDKALGFVDKQETGLAQPIYDDVVVDASGTVWINGTDGIARFEDGRWTWPLEGVSGLSHLAAGADGSIWAAGVGAHRIRAGDVPTDAIPQERAGG